MVKLGKLPARDAISFKFANFFDASKLPTPPAVFGHYESVGDFHGLGNDLYSNCVFAGAAHEHMIWSLEGGIPRDRFTTEDTLLDYAAVTGFDPTKPDTDQGTDMKAAADYRRKTGVRDATATRHRIDSYVALGVGNIDELALAIWLTGAAGVGLQFPSSAVSQFENGQPWDVPSNIQIAGGHYVPGVGRNAAGNILVVTWGKLQEMTPAFYQRFNDESVCYLDLEILNAKNLSPEGFDADGLRKQLASLT
jgi:hypothetical protein